MGKTTYEIVKWGDEFGYGSVIKETTKTLFKTTTKTWVLVPSCNIGSSHVFSKWTCAETGEKIYTGGFDGEAVYRAQYSLTQNPILLKEK